MTTTTGTATDQPPAPTTPPPVHRHGWIALLATIFGGLTLVIVLAQGAIAGLVATPPASSSQAVPVDGIRAIDLETGVSEFDLSFADVTEAELEVETSGWGLQTNWQLQVDGDTLVLDQSGWTWGLPSYRGTTTATLILPEELRNQLSAQIDLSVGKATITGDFRDVSLEVAAGDLTFEGSATSMDVDVSTGYTEVRTSGADAVTIDVSAGEADLTLTGAQPSTVAVDVSTGNADIRVPQGTYAVDGYTSVGNRAIQVSTDPASTHRITVDVSAGNATIAYSNN